MTVEALCKPPTVDDSRWGKMAPHCSGPTNYSQARERMTFNVVSAGIPRRDSGLPGRATAEPENGSPTSSRVAARG